ncbi:MAG: insulinase family protein, partial [Gemmatimonadota bacterium]|nr:insulinase family protein [Gemmatimonadota bacterium]
LDTAADVIADLIFRPALRDADLKLERKVILEEISMVDDTPDDIIFDVLNRELWGDHPHGFPILGTRDTVRGLKVSHLQSLHQRAYHPGRIVVAAAGNVSHDKLLDVMLKTGWHSEVAGASPPLATLPALARAPHAHHVSRTDIAQTHVVLASPSITHGDPRRFAFSLLSMLLGGGMSSRLFQRVREELGLAYSVHTFQSPFKDAGVHGVYLASAPESAQEALNAVREVLTHIAANGLPEAEITAGKRQLRGQLVLSLESVSARMYRAASSALYGEPVRAREELIALVDAIDVAAVADVARTFFVPENQTLVSLGPKSVQ